jgi:transposase
MPRPIPVSIRQAIFQLAQHGQETSHIAAELGLARSTVRRLLGRFRRQGPEGIAAGYRRSPIVEAAPSDIEQAALRLRREHPTWGAGLIRVHLLQAMPQQPIPSERTLQRWFVRADLSPAPAGRRPWVDLARATVPHETWQMDAKEHIRLQTRDEVSWLRIVDECSGAVLWTAVFPPRNLGARPRLGRARATSPGVHHVGIAGTDPSRQRHTLGFHGRLPHRAVALADRAGNPDALEQRAATPGEWGRRALARDVQPLVRALDLPLVRGVAVAIAADGSPVARFTRTGTTSAVWSSTRD